MRLPYSATFPTKSPSLGDSDRKDQTIMSFYLETTCKKVDCCQIVGSEAVSTRRREKYQFLGEMASFGQPTGKEIGNETGLQRIQPKWAPEFATSVKYSTSENTR
jgi:hypothetical protein